jgi:hypothetical protein
MCHRSKSRSCVINQIRVVCRKVGFSFVRQSTVFVRNICPKHLSETFVRNIFDVTLDRLKKNLISEGTGSVSYRKECLWNLNFRLSWPMTFRTKFGSNNARVPSFPSGSNANCCLACVTNCPRPNHRLKVTEIGTVCLFRITNWSNFRQYVCIYIPSLRSR